MKLLLFSGYLSFRSGQEKGLLKKKLLLFYIIMVAISATLTLLSAEVIARVLCIGMAHSKDAFSQPHAK